MELSADKIMISTEAMREWRAIRNATQLYQSVLNEDAESLSERQEVLSDGSLRLSIEVVERPFAHGMFLVVPPKHWRVKKEDA